MGTWARGVVQRTLLADLGQISRSCEHFLVSAQASQTNAIITPGGLTVTPYVVLAMSITYTRFLLLAKKKSRKKCPFSSNAAKMQPPCRQ